MAHELAFKKGKAMMAWTGQTPWHGLGAQMPDNADLTEWQKAAQLDWTAVDAPVLFDDDEGVMHQMDERKVLYRSDTKMPLSVVSNRYHAVQPTDIIELFRSVCETGGYTMETLGALRGGRRVWGMAKINDGVAIGHKADVVRPYLLLATSYDGSLQTMGRHTAIRVVCANTLRASDMDRDSDVYLPHNAKFDREEMRRRLGVFKDGWEKFQHQCGWLAKQPMNKEKASEFLEELIGPALKPKDDGTMPKASETAGYQSMWELFMGTAKGHEYSPGTRWGMLNAVSEYTDHQAGRQQETRLFNAWFGDGMNLKDRAMRLLVKA
jgi:phage/plasmid-like protein (TIGR03299 family)